jgi:Putative metallopeptidase
MVPKALNLQPDRIEVSYVPPKNTAREQIYRLIKQRVLEKVRDVLEPIAFTAARRLIAGVAYAYNREVSLPSTKKNRYADEHGLPAQRFYNVLCTAYEANQKLFADLVAKGQLPTERADGRNAEYTQISQAKKSLSSPTSMRPSQSE